MYFTKIMIVLLIFANCLLVTAKEKSKDLVFKYDFSNSKNIKLMGNAKITNGVLRLDGKNSYAIVPNSKKMNLTDKGITLVAVVKLNDSNTKDGANDSHDMFISKGREFIFGRTTKDAYINFHDGKKWAATTTGGSIPPNVWTQVVAVIERFDDAAQGDVGYKTSIYINGEEEISRRILWIDPKEVDVEIDIGKGFGGPWFLNGDIDEVAMYNKALSENEIVQLLDNSTKVKIDRKGFSSMNYKLRNELNTLKKKSSPEMQWTLNSLIRMANRLYPIKNIEDVFKKIKTIKSSKNIDDFAKKFNASQNYFTIVVNDSLAILLATKPSKGGYPIAGVLNRKNNREIFGNKTISWDIFYTQNGKKKTIQNNNPNISWKVNGLKTNKNQISFQILWSCSTPKFTATSNVNIVNSRIESNFAINNQDAKVIINDVTYPAFNFAHLKGKNDKMIFPWMSGVLVDKPMENRFIWGQEGFFPSGRIPFQFSAYYDDLSGIYFAFEDGLARTKKYKAAAKRNNLNISWTSPVGIDVNATGGNSFAINGNAVIELYDGKWFEAGQIYKRFLKNNASWWIKDLPRKDSPKWFTDNNLWMLVFSGTKLTTENLVAEVKYLREYFDLPFGVHWYSWEDNIKYGWPHFPPKNFVLDGLKKMKDIGVYVTPYSNARLWRINDGPNKSDYMYNSHGLKYAVKNADYSLNTEKYSDGTYVVMCPGAKGWRDWMVKLCDKLSSYGFNGIYHDQVATAAAKLCFDKNHGHQLNSSCTWIENGYDLMFKEIQSRNTHLCHTTEEASDPYLKAMDGYMVWRWTDANQIPLYQSIYSGRVQFVGRMYNHSKPGDTQSFFAKAAQQLINAEQIGWFTFSEIRKPNDKRLYVKKLMHIRNVLLPWFNGGEMLPPLKFEKAVPTLKSKWGGNFPQIVTTDKIATNSYKRSDNSTIYLFINTVDETVTITPKIKPNQTIWICKEGAVEPIKYTGKRDVTLNSRQSEIWIDGNKEQAIKIQAVMNKIASFDKGKVALPPRKIVGYKPASVGSGAWLKAENIKEVFDCGIAKGKTHVGWVNDGATISYGSIDFGKNAIENLEFNVAVSSDYEGGTIDFIVCKKNQLPQTVGSLELLSTGGFHTYKVSGLKLDEPISGVYDVTLKINGTAACNLKEWRFLK